MRNSLVKKLVLGGMILAVGLCVALYVVIKAPRKFEAPVVPSAPTVASNQLLLPQDLEQQKKAVVLDRFTRLTRREEKLGMTVVRGEPFVMLPPGVNSTSK